MAKQKSENVAASTAEKEVGQFVSRSEQFIENNKKNLSYGVLALAAVIAAIVAYNTMYLKPKSEKAANALFRGEQYFQIDSFDLALNGNGVDYDGFLQVIDQYGGTKSANLAKAYAGICYYKTGDMQSAIEQLKSFSAKDDNIAPAIVGLIGDCYVESGDVKQGISYFEKAAAKASNDFLSPVYLKKAGIAYESLKEYDNAVKAYTAIKEKHAASVEAVDIDKYIVRAQLAAKQ